jgi:hypothetical protein
LQYGYSYLRDIPTDNCSNPPPANWVATNGSLVSYWSPEYWNKEFFNLYLGKGLYWNGLNWVVGYWTMPAWSIKPCFDYSNYLLNPAQAKVCNKASHLLYPSLPAHQQSNFSLFSFPNCNSVTATRYIGSPL